MPTNASAALFTIDDGRNFLGTDQFIGTLSDELVTAVRYQARKMETIQTTTLSPRKDATGRQSEIDPDQIFSNLPQPYRMICKIIEVTLTRLTIDCYNYI